LTAEKSVVVQGKSIEEALQRAALLLHASTVDLAYEILQPGLVDQKGVVRIPYKLKVLPTVAPPSPREPDEFEDDSVEPPFSTEQLEALTSEEFLHLLETNVANQPESLRARKSEQPYLTQKPLEIQGDLTMTTGSVFNDGDIVIHGNVSRGVTVHAAGAIYVFGDVEVAQLEAGGNITIAGGMLGIARSMYGGVVCRYAHGAYIECVKLLTIFESTMHSNIISSTEIDVGETILGGTCTAPMAIYAKVTGSETGVVTKLFSGRNNKVRDEAEAVRQEAARLVVKLSETTGIIRHLSPKESPGKKGTSEERLKLWTAMSEKARLNDKLVALARRKNALIASIDQDRSARIKIADKVHPQTQIEIDDVGMTVKKLTQYVTFSKDYEAGALRMTSFR
jgi:uncharacterized protein (DUF342 family)